MSARASRAETYWVKRDAGTIDATPSKRIYSSIIADYSLNTGICELVDNSIDQWTKCGRTQPLKVSLRIDADQQSIRVEDNAGGVAYDDLALLVTPGATSGTGSEEQIGVFGVGSKRAVVALGQQVRILTRVPRKKTHLVEYDDVWLEEDDWRLTVFEVTDILPGSTVVDISKLRAKIDARDVTALREHLGATYALLLGPGRVTLSLNDEPIEPRVFDNWAFPPEYSPRRFRDIILDTIRASC
jgi:hypothetical protein